MKKYQECEFMLCLRIIWLYAKRGIEECSSEELRCYWKFEESGSYKNDSGFERIIDEGTKKPIG